MARALKDIITELDSVYNPQRSTFNKQMTELDPQLAAEQQGLESQKRDSFQQITDQANRRGLFYSGLPIAEEQRYTGSQFLPAVANLRAKYSSQKFGLQDAIAKLTADQYNQAQGLRQSELDREEEQRQFDARLRAQQEAEAASRRAAAAMGGGGWSPGGGMGDMGGAAPANDIKMRAQRDVSGLLQTKGTQEYLSTLVQINASAAKGNTYDQARLELLREAQPGLFRNGKLDVDRVNRQIAMYQQIANPNPIYNQGLISRIIRPISSFAAGLPKNTYAASTSSNRGGSGGGGYSGGGGGGGGGGY